MTISRKLVLAFLALGIGVSALSLMAVRPLEGGLSEVGAFHMPALLTMRAVQTEINGAVQETFAFLTTGDPGQRAQFEEHLANADVLLADFKRVAKLDDPAEAAEAAIFDRIVANRAALER
ncbi:MAG: hypothetical protein KJO43_14040, partial [Phycisphaerae bacterium]|nr:hypothetical protein [Phycisphaerae bacterium]